MHMDKEYKKEASPTLLQSKDPQKWKKYKAFDYVNELSALY